MIIAGTGHRPSAIGGYSDAVFNRLYTVAARYLESLEQNEPHRISHVISGMALGWDQALAEATIELGIPLQAYIPFEGQDAPWPKESRKRYARLLKRAAKVHVVSLPPYTNQKMQLRNMAMVDHCTHVLALWNPKMQKGGTYNCIQYALSRGRPIHNLWEIYIGQK